MVNPDVLTPPWLAEFLELSTVSRLVDIGCGSGAFTSYLRDQAHPSDCAIGIDCDPNVLLKVPQAVGLHWVCGDAASLPIKVHWADLVLCRRLLMNVSRPLTVVSEMVRIARPGGRVAALEPDFLSEAGHSTVPGELEFLQRLVKVTSTAADLGFGSKTVALFEKAGLDEIEAKTHLVVTVGHTEKLPTPHQEAGVKRFKALLMAWRSGIVAREGQRVFEELIGEATRLDRTRDIQVSAGAYQSFSAFPLWAVKGRKASGPPHGQ